MGTKKKRKQIAESLRETAEMLEKKQQFYGDYGLRNLWKSRMLFGRRPSGEEALRLSMGMTSFIPIPKPMSRIERLRAQFEQAKRAPRAQRQPLDILQRGRVLALAAEFDKADRPSWFPAPTHRATSQKAATATSPAASQASRPGLSGPFYWSERPVDPGVDMREVAKTPINVRSDHSAPGLVQMRENRSKPIGPHGPRLVLAGHGVWYPEDGFVQVPKGVHLFFYQHHGEVLNDPEGKLIDTLGFSDPSNYYAWSPVFEVLTKLQRRDEFKWKRVLSTAQRSQGELDALWQAFLNSGGDNTKKIEVLTSIYDQYIVSRPDLVANPGRRSEWLQRQKESEARASGWRAGMNYRPPVEVCDEGVPLPNYRLLPPNFAQFIKVMDPGKNMTQLRIASTPSHTKDFGRGKQDSMSLAELFQVIDRTQEVDLHWSACRQAILTNNDKMSQEEYLTVLEDVAKTFKKLRYNQPGLQMEIKNLKKEVIPLRKVRDEIRRILTARGVTIPSGADEPLRLCENLDVLSEALEAAGSVSSFSELLAYL